MIGAFKNRKYVTSLLLLGALLLFSWGEMHVRAAKNEVSIDVRYVSSEVPGCIYGYGQCRKSCLPKTNSKPSKNAYEVQNDCFHECSFLYQDCRQI